MHDRAWSSEGLLIVSGLDIEADVAALDRFEERVHDVTFASQGGGVRAAVERTAASLGEAIRSGSHPPPLTPCRWICMILGHHADRKPEIYAYDPRH